MFGWTFSKSPKRREWPQWDTGCDALISSVIKDFGSADTKTRDKLLKMISDIVEQKKHAESKEFDQHHIQKRLLDLLETLAKNIPGGSAFKDLPYTLRSNWLGYLLSLLDRLEFYLEPCKFDPYEEPQGTDEAIDVAKTHRRLMLETLKGAIQLLENIKFQGQMLRKIVNIFARVYLRTTVLNQRLIEVVNDLIKSEDDAYERLENLKIAQKRMDKRRKSLLAATAERRGGSEHRVMLAKVRAERDNSSSSLSTAATKTSTSSEDPSMSERSILLHSVRKDSAESKRVSTHSLSSIRSESSGSLVLYGWESEVLKLMLATRTLQNSESWRNYETKNPTLFNKDYFREDDDEVAYLPDRKQDKYLVTLVGHCGHFCVFLKELILLVLNMSVPVDGIERVAWGAIPNFQRLLRLFCHVIMRVQAFVPKEKKIADKSESGVPVHIEHDEKRRQSEEDTGPSERLYVDRRLQVQKAPQIVKAVKDCSVTLLENSDSNVFNLFLHALFSRTSVHNRAAVRRCLKWLSTWISRVPKIRADLFGTPLQMSESDYDESDRRTKKHSLSPRVRGGSGGLINRILRRTDSVVLVELLPEQIDYKYMAKGICSLLGDVHHLTLEMTLDFLYEELPCFFRRKVRHSIINKVILNPRIFRRLFMYWNPNVRGLFHHVLVYRCFLVESRGDLPLESDIFFIGGGSKQKNKNAPIEERKRSWIRQMNLQICEMYEKCFEPLIETMKGPLGKRLSEVNVHNANATYLKKSLEEYADVLATYYRRQANAEHPHPQRNVTVAPKLSCVKDYLQSKTNTESRDKKKYVETMNASSMWV
eukprot:g1593.t1